MSNILPSHLQALALPIGLATPFAGKTENLAASPLARYNGVDLTGTLPSTLNPSQARLVQDTFARYHAGLDRALWMAPPGAGKMEAALALTQAFLCHWSALSTLSDAHELIPQPNILFLSYNTERVQTWAAAANALFGNSTANVYSRGKKTETPLLVANVYQLIPDASFDWSRYGLLLLDSAEVFSPNSDRGRPLENMGFLDAHGQIITNTPKFMLGLTENSDPEPEGGLHLHRTWGDGALLVANATLQVPKKIPTANLLAPRLQAAFKTFRLSPERILQAAFNLEMHTDTLVAYANGTQLPASLGELQRIAAEVNDSQNRLQKAFLQELSLANLIARGHTPTNITECIDPSSREVKFGRKRTPSRFYKNLKAYYINTIGLDPKQAEALIVEDVYERIYLKKPVARPKTLHERTQDLLAKNERYRGHLAQETMTELPEQKRNSPFRVWVETGELSFRQPNTPAKFYRDAKILLTVYLEMPEEEAQELILQDIYARLYEKPFVAHPQTLHEKAQDLLARNPKFRGLLPQRLERVPQLLPTTPLRRWIESATGEIEVRDPEKDLYPHIITLLTHHLGMPENEARELLTHEIQRKKSSPK